MRSSSFSRHQGAFACVLRVACLAGMAWIAFGHAPAWAREDIKAGEAFSNQKVLVSSEKVVPTPPQKKTAKHSRKVEDEPQGIALSAPAPTPGHADKTHSEKTGEGHDEAQLASSDANEKKLSSEPSRKGRKAAKVRSSKRATPRKPLKQKKPVEAVKENAEDLKEAQAQMEAGDYAKAAELFGARLKEEPSDSAAFRGRTLALQRTGTAEALAALQDMATASPAPNGAAQAALAQVRAASGQSDEAVSLMWKALAAEPDNDQYRLTLAILFDRAGKKDMALSLYRQLRHGVPEQVQKRIQYLSQ